MSELEKLQEQNPYLMKSDSVILVALKDGWEQGVQAAYDAGWRKVRSEEELANWLAVWNDTAKMAMIKPHILTALLDLRQWLLEGE